MKYFNSLGLALLFAHLAASQTSTTTYTFTTKITTTITVNPIQTTSIINSSNVCPEASPMIASLESSIAILRSSLSSIFGLGGAAAVSVSVSPTSGPEVSRTTVFGRTVITPPSNMSVSTTAGNPVSMCSIVSDKISILQASIVLLAGSISYALNLSIPLGGGFSISPSISASSLPILFGHGMSNLSSSPVAAFITPAPTTLHPRANLTSSFDDHLVVAITDTVYSVAIDPFATTFTTASETPIPPTLEVQVLANTTAPIPTLSVSKANPRLTQSESPLSPTPQKSFAEKNIPDWWLIWALIGLMAFTTSALEPLTARQNIVPSGSPQPPAFLPPASTCSDNNSYICRVIGGHFTVTISTVGVPEGTSLPSTFFPFTLPLISTAQVASSTSQGNFLLTISSSRAISQPTTSITISEQAYLSNPESTLPSTFQSEQTTLATGTFSTSHGPVTSVIMTTTTFPASETSESTSEQLSTIMTATQKSLAVRSIAMPFFLQTIIDLATAVYTTSTSWLIVSEYSGFRNISVGKPLSTFTVPNSLSSPLKISTPQIPLTITPITSILFTEAVEPGSFPTEVEPPDTRTFSISHGPQTSVIISTTTLNSTSEQPSSSVAAMQKGQASRKLPSPVCLLVVCGFATAVIQMRVWKDGKKGKVEQTDKINEREVMERGERNVVLFSREGLDEDKLRID